MFHIRTVDKNTTGLSPELGWLQVQLENLSRPLTQLEDIDFLLQPISSVLSDPLLKELFEEGLAKAMSSITYSEFPLEIEWQRARIACYELLFRAAEE